jgi:hypothetical protein
MTEERKIHVVVIIADRQLTKFAQAADVFEPWKVLGRSISLTATLKPDCTVERAVGDVRRILESVDGNNHVVAAFVPGSLKGAYRDPSVRVVSNGKTWQTLDDMLKDFGWVALPGVAAAALKLDSRVAPVLQGRP